MCKSVDGQHPAESTRDTLPRDSFKVGTALLTAASLSVDDSVTMRIRQNLLLCHAHTTLRMQHAHGLNSEFAKLYQ